MEYLNFNHSKRRSMNRWLLDRRVRSRSTIIAPGASSTHNPAHKFITKMAERSTHHQRRSKTKNKSSPGLYYRYLGLGPRPPPCTLSFDFDSIPAPHLARDFCVSVCFFFSFFFVDFSFALRPCNVVCFISTMHGIMRNCTSARL